MKIPSKTIHRMQFYLVNFRLFVLFHNLSWANLKCWTGMMQMILCSRIIHEPEIFKRRKNITWIKYIWSIIQRQSRQHYTFTRTVMFNNFSILPRRAQAERRPMATCLKWERNEHPPPMEIRHAFFKVVILHFEENGPY